MAWRIVVFSVVTATVTVLDASSVVTATVPVLDASSPPRLRDHYSFSSCQCILFMHNDMVLSSCRVTDYPIVLQSLPIAIQRIDDTTRYINQPTGYKENLQRIRDAYRYSPCFNHHFHLLVFLQCLTSSISPFPASATTSSAPFAFAPPRIQKRMSPVLDTVTTESDKKVIWLIGTGSMTWFCGQGDE